MLIWWIYYFGNNVWGIPTDLLAGDWMEFYGSILAFLGTVFLGALALIQNKNFKTENDKSQERLSKAVEHLEAAQRIIAESNKQYIDISSRL